MLTGLDNLYLRMLSSHPIKIKLCIISIWLDEEENE